MAVVKMSDIAQRVGVSIAAVSMALNGRPGVSDAMRKRIIAEAEACGYDMNRLSVSADKKKRIIVYYADYPEELDNAYSISNVRTSFMKGLDQVAESKNIEFTQMYSKTGSFEASDIPPGTDGVLIVSVFWNEDLPERIAACGLPCVVVGKSFPGRKLHTVSYDNFGAIEQVMQQLYNAGHRRVGFVRTDLTCQNYEDRFSGWLSAAHRLGMTPGPVFEGQGNPEDIYEALLPWLPEQLANGTSAFITWNDYVAMAMMRALRSCGATPGQNVAVVGFDDMPFAALSDPPLATVRLQETDLSATAMTYLIDLIDHPTQPVTHRLLPLEFVPRESFCPAPER